MNSFIQHIPAFVDCDPPKRIDFSTKEDLLAIDLVRNCAAEDGFSHFALSGNSLMSIEDGGFNWWVIGFLADPASVDLPQWDGWKFRAKLPSGEIVVLSGNQVVSACGNELKLADGSIAIDLGY